MNRDEAQELLSQLRSLDQWRRHDTPSYGDPSSQSNMSGAYPKISHVAQQMSFPPVSSYKSILHVRKTQEEKCFFDNVASG